MAWGGGGDCRDVCLGLLVPTASYFNKRHPFSFNFNLRISSCARSLLFSDLSTR